MCLKVCEKLKVAMKPIGGTELKSFHVPEESSNSIYIDEKEIQFNFLD